ncbi:MAG: ABC transporter permease subunit [Anaerolineae bacterium]
MSLLVALRKEMLEQWRSYRLLVVTVVFAIFGLTSPLLAKLAPELLRLVPGGESFAQLVPPPTVTDAVGQYVKNLSQFGILLAILLAMGAVAQEKERGTAALVLVKPMPRWAFLLAKFAALAATFLAATTVAAFGAYYYTLLLFEPLNLGGWLALNGLLLLFFLVFIAITLFASTIGRSQATVGAIAFGCLLLVLALGSVPGIGAYLPGRLLSWGTALVLGGATAAWAAVAISLALIAAALLAGWAALERQEF